MEEAARQAAIEAGAFEAEADVISARAAQAQIVHARGRRKSAEREAKAEGRADADAEAAAASVELEAQGTYRARPAASKTHRRVAIASEVDPAGEHTRVELPYLSPRQRGHESTAMEAAGAEPRRGRVASRKPKVLNTPRCHPDGTLNAAARFHSPPPIPMAVSRELILSSCWSNEALGPRPRARPMLTPSEPSSARARVGASPRRSRPLVIGGLLDELDTKALGLLSQLTARRQRVPMPDERSPAVPPVFWNHMLFHPSHHEKHE